MKRRKKKINHFKNKNENNTRYDQISKQNKLKKIGLE